MGAADPNTDGACNGNPGPGGWGAVLEYGEAVKELFGGEPDTTNNRMELTAVIEALRALNRSCRVRIVTDSQYVQKGVESWMADWKRRNWKTSAGKPVANRDLWEELWAIHTASRVIPKWIRGHAGDPYNQAVDQLAKAAAMQEASR